MRASPSMASKSLKSPVTSTVKESATEIPAGSHTTSNNLSSINSSSNSRPLHAIEDRTVGSWSGGPVITTIPWWGSSSPGSSRICRTASRRSRVGSSSRIGSSGIGSSRIRISSSSNNQRCVTSRTDAGMRTVGLSIRISP